MECWCTDIGENLRDTTWYFIVFKHGKGYRVFRFAIKTTISIGEIINKLSKLVRTPLEDTVVKLKDMGLYDLYVVDFEKGYEDELLDWYIEEALDKNGAWSLAKFLGVKISTTEIEEWVNDKERGNVG